MILCLDVGNTQIHGGIFIQDELKFQFRKTSKTNSSSDEFGLFLRTVLRENHFNPDDVLKIAICSVVPEVVHSLTGACNKYFNVQPFFLQAGVKTGLKIKYRNPLEVGSDRIANSVAATHLYPHQNLIIIDFGTATTFCAISKSKEYLGGVIHAGIRLSMESLEQRTSKLPSVEIVIPKSTLGRSTVESIQSGLYYGTIGLVKEITNNIIKEEFNNEPTTVIGTGGISNLFKNEPLFNHDEPHLALKGLLLSLKLNS